MARANFVKAARKPIYQKGRRVEYVSKKGKREGQTLSKIDRTLPNEEGDEIYINIGESYYWWSFKNGPKVFSKEQPKPSQLTQSTFLSEFYRYQEEAEEFSCETVDEFDSFRDDLVSNLESLRDQCQDSLDNMPESLQYSPTGELLQERIDGLEDIISEIENVNVEELDEFEYNEDDTDYDEDEQRENWESEQIEKINEAISEVNDALGNASF